MNAKDLGTQRHEQYDRTQRCHQAVRRHGRRRSPASRAARHVTGFLGPNGAGKTTTMRMMLGLDAPSSGAVTVNGHPYRARAHCMRSGALLDAKAAHGGHTAHQHLRWLGRRRHSPTAGRGRARPRGAVGCGRQRAGRLLARDGPAARHRGGAARRPAHPALRRAGERARSGGHPLDPLAPAAPRRRGPHDLPLQPPDERDGGDRGPHHRHRSRPADRRRQHRRVDAAQRQQPRPGCLAAGRRARGAARRAGAPSPTATAR